MMFTDVPARPVADRAGMPPIEGARAAAASGPTRRRGGSSRPRGGSMAGLVAALLVPLALLSLGGCDYFAEKKLVPGVHTEADVRNFMGKPEMIREMPDGSRRLEYPRSPMGAQTYFVTIDRNGKFQGMEKAMNDANFAKVAIGMSKDDVRGLLGRATETLPLALKKEEVWSWRYEADGSQLMFFNVYFDDATGKVTRITRDRDWKGMGG